MKTRIVIEIQGGMLGMVGQTGFADPVDIILIDRDLVDEVGNVTVNKYEPDWQSPTAAEMYEDEPEIQEQIKKIEEEE